MPSASLQVKCTVTTSPLTATSGAVANELSQSIKNRRANTYLVLWHHQQHGTIGWHVVEVRGMWHAMLVL